MTVIQVRNRWFQPYRHSQTSTARLFCFHFAGGGASVFRGWAEALPQEIDVLAAQLPGRESRFSETRYTRMGPLITELADQIEPFLHPKSVFFGHSMGAMVAFELIRELRRRGHCSPLVFFPAGRRAPQIADEDPPMHNLPEEELVTKLLNEYRDTLPAVMQNPELRELMLPMLRADFELCETYRYEQALPLDCPIIALGGADDPDPTEAQLLRWKEMTTGSFRHFQFPGDHFFIDKHKDQVLRLIRNILQSAL